MLTILKYNTESAVNNQKLSPMNCYYLRKLLRQNIDKLEATESLATRIQAEPLADLNAIISSIYLENTNVDALTNKLGLMITYHQALDSETPTRNQELVAIERQIFKLLGFK